MSKELIEIIRQQRSCLLNTGRYAIYLVAAQYEDMLYLGTQYLSLFSLEGRL